MGGLAISGIGQLNEYTLHQQLKQRYCGKDSQQEVKIGDYVVDVVCGGTLIEIQTKGFWGIRKKLVDLLKDHPVRLVYPMPLEKVLVVYDKHKQNVLYRRKSPKKGMFLDVAGEIMYILPVLKDPRFTLEVLLTKEEEIRIHDGRGSWRRRGISIHDRSLVDIIDTREFASLDDYRSLLPQRLPSRFTNRDLSELMDVPQYKVSKLTYCFKHLEILKVCGKEGKAQVFAL